MAKTCCAHGVVSDYANNNVWVCCELAEGHVGRHQQLNRQKTQDRGYVVVLWDNDVPHPNGLCPMCGE